MATEQTPKTIRLDPEDHARIVALADALTKRDRRRTTITDAHRMALARGLVMLEDEAGVAR